MVLSDGKILLDSDIPEVLSRENDLETLYARPVG